MSVWNVYDERNEVRGQTRRETVRRREISRLERRVPDSLSYHDVEIFDNAHGYDIESVDGGESAANTPITKNVAIMNTDNLNEKFICSLPEDDIEHGSLVHWMDNYWLVTERDANTTLYTKSKMVQCNHLLRWVDTEGIVHAQWCIIEDGTKYLTGEYEDRLFVTTRGDSRIAMTIARNDYTKNFTRACRFLIDDPESPLKLAYALTKPLKLGWSFNNKGCYKFVLQEVNSTSDDNIELGIADYYKYHPHTSSDDINGDNENVGDNEQGGTSPAPSDNTGRGNWL